MDTNRKPRPATSGQFDLIRKLKAEASCIPSEQALEQLEVIIAAANKTRAEDQFDFDFASSTITAILDLKRRFAGAPSTSTPAAELEDGVYLQDGTYFKVVHAVHGSGQQYAKKLVRTGNKWTWEYEGKRPLHKLTAGHKLTAEQATEFGQLYGQCINCARALTREESLSVSYGPTCAAKNGWYYPTKKELASVRAGGAVEADTSTAACSCNTMNQHIRRCIGRNDTD